MPEKIRIAIDAMGGDNAPGEIAAGAVSAVNQYDDVHVILVGQEEKIRQELARASFPSDALSVRHASEVIEMAEPPVAAVRTKKDSSLVTALRMVKNKEADAFISAGNSGAVLVGGQGIVGRIRGIERPPFATVIPTEKGCSLLLDCGANVDARAEHLVQFARIGSLYMEHVMGVSDPTVGIINIGAEEDKGNALVKETFPLLKACSQIRFTGSVEARDIPTGGVDVLVCEGFAGNLVLKMYEGTASTLLKIVKKSLTSSLKTKIGALLIKKSLKETLKDYDASRYGGAPLLGLNGLVVKIHGNATRREVCNAVGQCRQFIRQDMNGMIRQELTVSS